MDDNRQLTATELIRLARIWNRGNKELRFGQAIMNIFFPCHAAMHIYYESDVSKALVALSTDPRFCIDAEKIQRELAEVQGQHFNNKLNEGEFK